MKLLSIVISTFNRKNLLVKTLNSLVAQLENHVELIIVDNNSTDETKTIFKKFYNKDIYYFNEKKQGISYARNYGAKKSRGKYIAFIDDDAIADKNWIKNIEETIKKQPKAVLIGGKIIPFYRETPPKWFKDSLEIRTWGEKEKFLDESSAKNGFSGSNFIIKKDIFFKFGGLNTNLGMSKDKLSLGEETMLFRKIFKIHPYFFYNPKIIVKHLTTSKSWNIIYRLKRSIAGGKIDAFENLTIFNFIKKLFLLLIEIVIFPISPFFSKKDSFTITYLLCIQKIFSKIGYIEYAILRK